MASPAVTFSLFVPADAAQSLEATLRQNAERLIRQAADAAQVQVADTTISQSASAGLDFHLAITAVLKAARNGDVDVQDLRDEFQTLEELFDGTDTSDFRRYRQLLDQDNAFSATGSWLPTEAFSHAVDTRALYTALEEEGSLQCLPPAALFTADVGGPEAQQAVEALSRRLQRLSDESPFFLVYVRGKLDLTTAGSSGTAWTEGNRQEVEGCKAIGLACFIPARLIPGEITIEVQGHIAPESSFVTSLVVAERDGDTWGLVGNTRVVDLSRQALDEIIMENLHGQAGAVLTLHHGSSECPREHDGANMWLKGLLNSIRNESGDAFSNSGEAGLQLKLELTASFESVPPQMQPALQVIENQVIENQVTENNITRLPGSGSQEVRDIHPEQKKIAQQLLDRLIVIAGAEPEPAAEDMSRESWRNIGRCKLQEQYPDGLQVLICVPRFNSLVAQTKLRLVKAELRNLNNWVVQYRESSDEAGFHSFRQEAIQNARSGGSKMYLMIADECHWGVNAAGAVDKIVNDQANGSELLRQTNFFRLLVSATPYAILTTASALPVVYYKHSMAPLSSSSSSLTAIQGLPMYAHIPASSADQDLIAALKKEPLHQDAPMQELHVLRWQPTRHPDIMELPVESYWGIEEALMIAADHQVVAGVQASHGQLPGIIKDSTYLKNSKWSTFTLLADYLVGLQMLQAFRGDHTLVTEEGVTPFHHQLMIMAAEIDDLGWAAPPQRMMQEMARVLLGKRYNTRQGIDSETRESVQQAVLARLAAPTPTDSICKSLLWWQLEDASPPAMSPSSSSSSSSKYSWRVEGAMTVVRVPNQKQAAVLYHGLEKWLTQNGHVWRPDSFGQAPCIISDWRAFQVLMDIGHNERQGLSHKLWPFFQRCGLSLTHPSAQEATTYADLATQRHSKRTELAYTDLHGVPCLLILVEKGRMGDTFPQTFQYMDCRIRLSNNYTTRVQELGRLCRYPKLSGGRAIVSSDLSQSLTSEQMTSALHLLLQKLAQDETTQQESITGSSAGLAASCNKAACSMTVHDEPQALQRAAQAAEPLHVPGQNPVNFEKTGSKAEHDQWIHYHDCMKRLIKGMSEQDQHLMPLANGIRLCIQHTGEKTAVVLAYVVTWHQLLKALLPLLLHNATSDSVLGKALAKGSFAVIAQPLQHRLPTAVTADNTLDTTLRKWRDRSRANAPANLDDFCRSLAGCMLVPGKCDRFTQRKSGSTGPVVDFRESYAPRMKAPKAGASDSSMGEADALSYLGQAEKPHSTSNLLLLHAECQIGKTGAYLAFIQELTAALQPNPATGGADLVLKEVFEAPPLASTRELDARYLQPFGHMRWHFPFVLDLMKLGNQAFDNLPPLLQLDHSTGWGQDFKGYTDVSSGKYAPKWLVHRLLQLVEAQSLEQYRTNLLASEPYSSCAGRDCLNVALSRMQRYQYQDILFPTPVNVDGEEAHSILIMNAGALWALLNFDKRLSATNEPLYEGQLSSFSVCEGPDSSVRHTILKYNEGCDSSQPVLILATGYLRRRANHGQPGQQRLAGRHGKTVMQSLCWPETSASSAGDADKPVRDVSDGGPIALRLSAPEVPFAAPIRLQIHQESSGASFNSELPKMWLAPGDYAKLGNIAMPDGAAEVIRRLTSAGGCLQAVQSWIFIPTYGRHRPGTKQALLDWSKAVGPDTAYFRLLVVRSSECEAYWRLVLAMQQQQQQQRPYQVTGLLEMPTQAELRTSTGGMETAYAAEGGCGYARRIVQEVAEGLQLRQVWMVDDNVRACYALNAERMVAGPSGAHQLPSLCGFDRVMRTIEAQAGIPQQKAEQRWRTAAENDGLILMAPCKWSSGTQDAIRHLQPCAGAEELIHSREQFSGSWQGMAMLGLRNGVHRWTDIGTVGHPPFKVTHSVYVFYLLNIRATMGRNVRYAPCPAREDIDFNFSCEEAGLVVAKCNTLMFCKTNLQLLNTLDLITLADDCILQVQPCSVFGGQSVKLQIQLPAQMQSWSMNKLQQKLQPLTLRFLTGNTMSDASTASIAGSTQLEPQLEAVEAGGVIVVSAPTSFSKQALQIGLEEALNHVKHSSSSRIFMHTVPAELKMGSITGKCSIQLVSFYAWASVASAGIQMQIVDPQHRQALEQDRALFAKVEEVRTASSKWNDNSMILENLAISRLRGIDSADTARTGQAHRIITAAVLGDEAQGTSQPEGPYQSLCYSRYAAPVVPTITVEVATKEPDDDGPSPRKPARKHLLTDMKERAHKDSAQPADGHPAEDVLPGQHGSKRPRSASKREPKFTNKAEQTRVPENVESTPSSSAANPAVSSVPKEAADQDDSSITIRRVPPWCSNDHLQACLREVGCSSVVIRGPDSPIHQERSAERDLQATEVQRPLLEAALSYFRNQSLFHVLSGRPRPEELDSMIRISGEQQAAAETREMERKIDIICLLTHARGLRILQASVPSIRLLGYSINWQLESEASESGSDDPAEPSSPRICEVGSRRVYVALKSGAGPALAAAVATANSELELRMVMAVDVTGDD